MTIVIGTGTVMLICVLIAVATDPEGVADLLIKTWNFLLLAIPLLLWLLLFVGDIR